MRGNLVLSIITILFSIYFLILALQFESPRRDASFGPGGWPAGVLSLMGLMGIILLIRAIREWKVSSTRTETDGDEGLLAKSEKVEEEFAEVTVHKSKYLFVIGTILVYLLAVATLGFIITTPLFLIAIAFIIGIEKWMPMILGSIVGTACLTYLFPILLNTPLPRGIGVFRDFSLLFY